MSISPPRVPSFCPPGFPDRYIVVRGDTMWRIAGRYGVSLQGLILANQHIPDPNLIYPGDVLCVPRPVRVPCCVVLRPVVAVPRGSAAGAIVYLDSIGVRAISVVAVLPDPSHFGNFDGYVAEGLIPEFGGYGNALFLALETPRTWATTFSPLPLVTWTPDTRVHIQPFISTTGVSGPEIFAATLDECR